MVYCRNNPIKGTIRKLGGVVMQTIEERARSYAEGCELQCKEARKAEFDYIAGAREERILLTEQVESWLANMVCEGVLETGNLPRAIARFKEDFNIK